MGSFVLGFAEFVIMGILPVVAEGVDVSVAWAGNFITAYAVGVCAGAAMLVAGRRVPPRNLLVLFMAICLAGNRSLRSRATRRCSRRPVRLGACRTARVLRHGDARRQDAAADLVAEGAAVSTMVLGQTLANTVGVPAGTLLAGAFSGTRRSSSRPLGRLRRSRSSCTGSRGSIPFPMPALRASSRFSRPLVRGSSWARCSWATPACSAGGATCRPGRCRWAGSPRRRSPACSCSRAPAWSWAHAGRCVGDRLTPGVAAALGQSMTGLGLLLLFLFGHGPIACCLFMFLCSVGLSSCRAPSRS